MTTHHSPEIDVMEKHGCSSGWQDLGMRGSYLSSWASIVVKLIAITAAFLRDALVYFFRLNFCCNKKLEVSTHKIPVFRISLARSSMDSPVKSEFGMSSSVLGSGNVGSQQCNTRPDFRHFLLRKRSHQVYYCVLEA